MDAYVEHFIYRFSSFEVSYSIFLLSLGFVPGLILEVTLVSVVSSLTLSSDDGYNKPTLIPYVPTGTLQVPSNVTRISRGMKRVGFDGTPQIIYVSVSWAIMLQS